MIESRPSLMDEIRHRFAHVDECPYQGKRVFFENAGGALTLKSVIEVTARLAAIPDNQGRDNPASRELARLIEKCRADTLRFMHAEEGGQILLGESGTELLFRLICSACMGSAHGGEVLGSSLEHPASRSAVARWAPLGGKTHVLIAHDPETGSIESAAYARHVTREIRVVTIVHTSPVTGMSVDVAAIARVVRTISPDCLIVVDGIQHASHGTLDLASYDVDGYVISPYKVFSRHGYALAWISERLAALPHNRLIGAPEVQWELGTRDTSAYAAFSEVVRYFEWLGGHFTDSADPREQIEAAGRAVHAHEQMLTEALLRGTGNLVGLAGMSAVSVIGGVDNHRREGLVSFAVEGMDSSDLVSMLSERGIRVHVRKDDHYSGNILEPLGLRSCVRVSLCHYNTREEVARFLMAVRELLPFD